MKDCEKCHDNCKLCNLGDSCTECKRNRDNSTPFCDNCTIGFWENSTTNFECEPCNKNCYDCEELESCTICNLYRNESTQLCECIIGYWDNNQMRDCEKCHNNCYDCEFPDSCTICNKNRNFSIQLCPCDRGYWATESMKDCEPCYKLCASCLGPDKCLECLGLNRNQSTDFCDCNYGFYDDGTNLQNCMPCSRVCAGCQVFDQCKACNGTHRLPAPSCLCEEGYFDDLVNQDCQKCPLECETCISAQDCTSCRGENRDLIISRGLGKCRCLEGYFDAKDYGEVNCLICHPKCTGCTRYDRCLECSENRLSAPNCACVAGFYLKDERCEECRDVCTTCQDYEICRTCVEPDRRDPVQQCRCRQEYYNDPYTKKCLECDERCKEGIQVSLVEFIYQNLGLFELRIHFNNPLVSFRNVTPEDLGLRFQKIRPESIQFSYSQVPNRSVHYIDVFLEVKGSIFRDRLDVYFKHNSTLFNEFDKTVTPEQYDVTAKSVLLGPIAVLGNMESAQMLNKELEESAKMIQDIDNPMVTFIKNFQILNLFFNTQPIANLLFLNQSFVPFSHEFIRIIALTQYKDVPSWNQKNYYDLLLIEYDIPSSDIFGPSWLAQKERYFNRNPFFKLMNLSDNFFINCADNIF